MLDDLVRELLPGARSFDKADTVGVLHNVSICMFKRDLSQHNILRSFQLS